MGYFFSDALRRILFLLLLMFIISLDLGLRRGFYYGLFFLRRVASHLVLVVVDVYYFIRFGVGRGLLYYGLFFLRRVASHLVLVVVDVYYFIRFGVGRGLLLWAIFSPTRCVASCSCCC